MSDFLQLPGPLSLDVLQLYAGCYTTESQEEDIDTKHYSQVNPLHEMPSPPSPTPKP